MNWTDVALSLGGVGLTAASSYGVMRLKNARLQGRSSAALEVLESLVLPTVTEIAQDATLQLKAAAKDGKLTKEEASAALEVAAEEIVADLPRWAAATLTKTAGSKGAMVERLVKPQVEVAVKEVKKTVPNYVIEDAFGAVKDEVRRKARARLGL